jgi:hypothetical protein
MAGKTVAPAKATDSKVMNRDALKRQQVSPSFGQKSRMPDLFASEGETTAVASREKQATLKKVTSAEVNSWALVGAGLRRSAVGRPGPPPTINECCADRLRDSVVTSGV